MNNSNQKQLTDSDVRLFFDGAERLLRIANKDGETAQKAISELAILIQKIDRYSKEIRIGVVDEINKSATRTANQAADLLSEKFLLANNAAECYQLAAKKAAEKYNEAARIHSETSKKRLFRDLPVFLFAQLIFFGIIAIMVSVLTPSLDEIQHRRHELAEINSQLEANRVEWRNCKVGDHTVRCIKTDEEKYSSYSDDDGNTYRVPWKQE